jgi:hypothetical protein
MNLADVNIPAKFTEETEIFSGDKTLSKRSISGMTKKRQKAENSILQIAAKNSVPVDEVVKRILVASTSQLRNYVQSKGETPQSNPIALAVQAALLRADEVGTIAKAIGTTDSDSLLQIEEAEQDAINNNNADVKNILQPDVQAALKLTLDYIKSKHSSGNLSGFIQQLKRGNKFDGFDLNTASLLGSPTGGKIGSKSIGGSNLPNGFAITDLADIDSSTVLTNDTPPAQTSGGFFSIFDKIVSGIGSVTTSITGAAGAVKDAIGSTKDSITGLLGGVSDTASDIGADSIQKAIKDYIPYIIAGVAAVVLIIVIAIYANKRK